MNDRAKLAVWTAAIIFCLSFWAGAVWLISLI
jgi:hypothetical protein